MYINKIQFGFSLGTKLWHFSLFCSSGMRCMALYGCWRCAMDASHALSSERCMKVNKIYFRKSNNVLAHTKCTMDVTKRECRVGVSHPQSQLKRMFRCNFCGECMRAQPNFPDSSVSLNSIEVVFFCFFKEKKKKIIRVEMIISMFFTVRANDSDKK